MTDFRLPPVQPSLLLPAVQRVRDPVFTSEPNPPEPPKPKPDSCAPSDAPVFPPSRLDELLAMPSPYGDPDRPFTVGRVLLTR